MNLKRISIWSLLLGNILAICSLFINHVSYRMLFILSGVIFLIIGFILMVKDDILDNPKPEVES